MATPLQRNITLKLAKRTAQVYQGQSILMYFAVSVSPPIQHYSRHDEETTFYPFSLSTRCEEWSTLRQILPSKGRSIKQRPPRWGSDKSEDRKFTSKKEVRFPIINSPMTQYIDDMHLTNRLFKLH